MRKVVERLEEWTNKPEMQRDVTRGQIVTRISIIDIAKDNPKDNVDKVG